MSAIKLASRYAKALLDIAIETGKLEEVYQDHLFLQKMIRESREFEIFLNSPVITPDKKLKVMKQLTDGKISNISVSFLQLLIRKSREVYLKEIAGAFVKMYFEYKRITKV